MKEELKSLEKTMRQVGTYQLSMFRSRHLKVESKSSPNDLVTQVDKESEKTLIQYINKNYPEHSILGEESGLTKGKSKARWIIDPLDGTVNYTQGLPFFAISVALEEKESLTMGAVYVPCLDEMYTAIKGKGAHLNGYKIQVGKKKELTKSIIGTGFPYDKSDSETNNIQQFLNLTPKFRAIRRFGAAAYDLCLVASGFLDGYWEYKLRPWDVAAGALIVQEAGGKVITNGDEDNLSVIAGNTLLAGQLKKELKL